MGILNDLFGTGETGGDNKWEAPVHGTRDDGRPITFSSGRSGTSREKHTLARDGHSGREFYREADGRKGHEHVQPDGSMHPGGDRGKSN